MNLEGKKLKFRAIKGHSNLYRLMLWIVLLVIGGRVLWGYSTGSVKPFFLATPTATRTTNSYALEGDTDFNAGDLEKAIVAYKEATTLDPGNAELWVKLARIQTYSSASLTTNDEQLARLKDALNSISMAVKDAPEESDVHAVKAFVLDWYANPTLIGKDKVDSTLVQASGEASLALTEDQTNTQALAYYAEILVDQSRWQQAQQYIDQANQADTNLMDVHRIYAYVYESQGDYSDAITEYLKAIDLAPNLTFLKISVGKVYRQLGLYDQALSMFALAAKQNQQLGINDPIPYLAIANTYIRTGDNLIAVVNVQKALAMDPTSPDVYAQLGMAYHSSRNYEGAIPAFKCALLGCTAAESCDVRNDCGDKSKNIVITGMKLTDDTVAYYYTYGSVLAGLYVPGQTVTSGTVDYCTQSMTILKEVAASYASDSTIMAIVKTDQDICSSN